LCAAEEKKDEMVHPDPKLKLVIVFESPDPVELHLAESALEQAGIEFAAAEEALTGFGFSPIVNPVSRIQVAEDRAAEAKQAIDQAFGRHRE
jgi:hypothetical protein